MTVFEDIKYWARSGSLDYARARRRRGPEKTLRWRGRAIHYRPGTSDTALIDKILLKPRHKREYDIPAWVKPEVILDIGANIGVASLYLASLFPEARILSFEPEPENFRLLVKNTASLNVTPFPFGLGARDETLALHPSDDAGNFGGFSFFERGVDPTRSIPASVRRIDRVLEEQKIERIDLIKVDTEGAEHDILTALDSERLETVKWITGELHGERDFELLAYLSRRFHVSVRKPLDSRLGYFQACHKSLCFNLSPSLS